MENNRIPGLFWILSFIIAGKDKRVSRHCDRYDGKKLSAETSLLSNDQTTYTGDCPGLSLFTQ